MPLKALLTRSDINGVIFTITQSLIALAVVIGGGFTIAQNPNAQSVPFISGLIGTVIGFYLSEAKSKSTTDAMIRVQDNAKK